MRDKASKADVKKKKKFAKGLLTHEVNALAGQGASFNLEGGGEEQEEQLEHDAADEGCASDLSPDSNAGSSRSDSQKKSSSSRSSVASIPVRGGKTFMDRFADSMALLTEEDPADLELERRKKEMELRHKEKEFEDQQDEKRRRLVLDEKAQSLQEKAHALQERQLAFMEAFISRIH